MGQYECHVCECLDCAVSHSCERCVSCKGIAMNRAPPCPDKEERDDLGVIGPIALKLLLETCDARKFAKVLWPAHAPDDDREGG